MIDLSITSPLFILCLLVGPLIIAQNLKLRRWSFLITSGGFFVASMNTSNSLFFAVLFLLIPYAYAYLIRRWNVPLWPILVIQVAFYIYLNKYGWILDAIHIPIPSYISIMGLSYILFRQLDILFQVKSRLVNEVNFLDYLNYLLSFWTILAGPIQRYREFSIHFYEPTPISDKREILGYLHRAVNGFVQVVILGPIFLFITTEAEELYRSSGDELFLILVFYCFPVYLYLNFSGYCDIVIGFARWAGFVLPENFNRPWLSRDMIEMWNRWHISLSEWLRDYLYQPLLKFLFTHVWRSHFIFNQYVSIFITFFTIGIWHGTTVNYVAFGLFQGIGMVISMIYRNSCKKYFGKMGYKKYYTNRWIIMIERLITFHFCCFSLLFFQYDPFSILHHIVKLGGIFC